VRIGALERQRRSRRRRRCCDADMIALSLRRFVKMDTHAHQVCAWLLCINDLPGAHFGMTVALLVQPQYADNIDLLPTNDPNVLRQRELPVLRLFASQPPAPQWSWLQSSVPHLQDSPAATSISSLWRPLAFGHPETRGSRKCVLVSGHSPHTVPWQCRILHFWRSAGSLKEKRCEPRSMS
jgi:hypothetical protein